MINHLTALDNTQTQTLCQTSLSDQTSALSKNNQKKSRQQWTIEQYKEMIWCFYCAQETKIDGGVVIRNIKEMFRQNLKMLQGHPLACVVQKIAVLGTAHILRQVLGWIAVISCCKCFNISSEEHIFFWNSVLDILLFQVRAPILL